jgi:subtilisin family serine protease
LDDVYSYTNAGVEVHAYIIDTGINSTHQEFTGRIGDGFDFVDNDNSPDDCHGHGTHVAGTLGGTTYGVAKEVTLHAVRVTGCGGTAATIIAGVKWVTQNRINPAVVNMSLSTKDGKYPALDTAVQNSIASGLLYTLSAGNKGVDECTNRSPTALEAITVGSTTSSDNRSSFSNIGSCLDIFAPGDLITSTWIGNQTATKTISGTSMAAPHVAGAAALLLQEDPSRSVAEITNIIINSSSKNKITDVGLSTPNE